MSRVKNSLLQTIADRVRPHITPLLNEKSGYTLDELKSLVWDHTPHRIVSERSLRIIDAYLCEQ